MEWCRVTRHSRIFCGLTGCQRTPGKWGVTNNNIGIVYCMPDFMMSLKDLQQDIKIGIKTKLYEHVKCSNLVINIGFIGRCTNYGDNNVKIQVEDVVNLLTTKGVGIVKPETLSTKNLAGLEWDLEDFAKRTEIVIPKSSLVYQTTLEKTSIRFIDYKKNNIQESEEYQEELTETKIDSVTLEGRDYPIKRILYEADGVIAEEEDLLKIETLALRKGKIEEDERLIYDILGNIVVIELIEDNNETIESDNDLEMMEDEVSTTTSLTPFTRSQPMDARHNRRNLPRPQANYENKPRLS